ncbi:allophanate hydrolase [Nakamurella multipartita DSM 44233]|uniref:Allophanate hydrolase n=2 Tax=Nakamurella TaxID=53460 RepID=C8XI40_NAKMY|nr:allophanate hydrolase [Nakamurella multipartita DSM 44233]
MATDDGAMQCLHTERFRDTSIVDNRRMSKRPAPGPADGPTIDDLTTAYRTAATTVSDVVDGVLASIADRGDDGTWISVAERSELLLRAKQLEAADPTSLPLYGIPFGVKDSIDVAGVATTLACPDYAYRATQTAPVVERLIEAGAIYVGKTNLDQFATGLNGTRTPYPVPRSVFGGELISGGSSSGSALAVASGQVPFAVATDTAGSGRVPPALNGIVGLKPSRGLISTVGLVPACRSLDCISLMARNVPDIATVLDVVAAPDDRDPFTRLRRREAPDPGTLRIGLPDPGQLEFFGDAPMRDAHLAARARIGRDFERVVTAPFGPFLAAGELLYQGPWVAERLTEFGEFLSSHPDSVLPVISTIMQSGDRYSAVDVFAAEHRLGELKTEVRQLWRAMDVLILPAIGTTFTVDQVLADPIATNTMLGHYTHFGNLLDLCAAVVPAGLTADGRPAALMVLGPALADDRVLAVAAALSGDLVPPAAPPPGRSRPGEVTLAVVGHHLSGQPRCADLLDRGGRLLATTTTAESYRLLRTGGPTPVPVLVTTPDSGAAIEVELWGLPAAALPEILARSSPSVCLGRVALADGRTEIGFVADTSALDDEDLADITAFGGWRAYLAAR